MNIVELFFPFLKNKKNYSYTDSNPLSLNMPNPKIDFNGAYNMKRLTSKIHGYLDANNWFSWIDEFQNKGKVKVYTVAFIKKINDYYKLKGDVRLKAIGWRKNDDPDKPDMGFIRIWVGENSWSIENDYQGWYKEKPFLKLFRNFYDKYFGRREFETEFQTLLQKELYQMVEVVKKELGIDTIAYADETSLPSKKGWS